MNTTEAFRTYLAGVEGLFADLFQNMRINDPIEHDILSKAAAAGAAFTIQTQRSAIGLNETIVFVMGPGGEMVEICRMGADFAKPQ